jgi:hypothetical protein
MCPCQLVAWCQLSGFLVVKSLIDVSNLEIRRAHVDSLFFGGLRLNIITTDQYTENSTDCRCQICCIN